MRFTRTRYPRLHSTLVSFHRGKLIFFFWVTAALPAIAQDEVLHRLLNHFDKHRIRTLQEKLYIHTDRSTYVAGETVWLAIYCVDGTFHKPLDFSKVAYVEILDKDTKPVAQTKVELNKGGQGSLFLSPVIGTGTYTLRGYTQWMKNMSPDFYFHETITIINTFRNPSLENSAPVTPTPDVRFFPEGGNLVQGLASKIAVKAIDSWGKSFDFTGAVVNQNNDTVARFRSYKFGMGSFYFTPQPNTKYRAVIRNNSGKFTTHNFPYALAQGYIITLTEKSNTTLELAVQAAASDGTPAYLLCHTRQVVNHAATQKLINGRAIFLIDKTKLGEGISHFTIFDESGKPVCERLFFKRVERHLTVQIKPDQESYGLKKKIKIDFATQDHDLHPVPAALSVSVFRTDSLEFSPSGNISEYVWLTSELRGFIESPEYYFNFENQDVNVAADNLMLTQGWRRFRWTDVVKDTFLTPYLPEFRNPLIRGKVLNRFSGATASGITTFLTSPGVYGNVNGSISDSQGDVQYEMEDFYGAKRIIAQVSRPKDSLYRIELKDPFSDSVADFRPPRFIQDKRWNSSLTLRNLHMQLQNAFHEDKNSHTREWNVLDTIPFYGAPVERYYLDDYTRFKTMEDVMREYVKGIWVRKREGKFVFLLPAYENRSLIHHPLVLVDGVPADVDSVMRIDPLRIKRVDVLMKKYYYGSLTFSGVVNLTSYKGDLAGLIIGPQLLSTLYDGLQEHREFYAPQYDTETSNQSRAPDFRDLLYWAPRVISDGSGKATLEFYSSEQDGDYIVVVQGMTDHGVTGSATTVIRVNGPIN